MIVCFTSMVDVKKILQKFFCSISALDRYLIPRGIEKAEGSARVMEI
jgi:hypothetical protein